MTKAQDFFRQQSICLIAHSVYIDYLDAIHNFLGIEPEMFVEFWLIESIEGYDEDFNNGVCKVFLDKLVKLGKNG